ncbi:hypothetical protein 7778G3H09_23 [Haloquadratum phage sp.]|jgi:hypothetical protein|nr:hypothetical protein 7778G3H09_23 [Haloquadratum phage sp.]
MIRVLTVSILSFFHTTEYQYAHGVDCQHKRLQITLDTIGNMTDSVNVDTDADADEQTNEHRLPFQSVAESDTLWVCLDTLQKMTRQFEDESDENSETINKHLRDAQISMQKAKNARRQSLIFDRVYDKIEQDKLQVDEYELEVDNALE